MGKDSASPRVGRGTYAVAGMMLGAPFVALLWVSSYAREKPRLLGFPFFYWYQFLWVLLSAALTWGAYSLVRRAEQGRRGAPDPAEPRP